jgi:nucleoside-diphosphate-sugar epimerase
MDLGLRPDDRVLVLGASGWFGREFSALMSVSESDCVVLEVPGPSSGVSVSEGQVRDFAPTVILNFAFLTRERVAQEGIETFTRVNEELTNRFLLLAELPSVRSCVTVSSGAAVTESSEPYGRLKAAEESRALALATDERSVVVARAYAVSGGYVRRPRDYAFSDFILQAHDGFVRVQADRPVFRRYCAVPDVLAVALRSVIRGRSGVFDTGGDLVEMGDLAHDVVALVNPRAEVERAVLVTEVPSAYHSDDLQWREWCGAVGVTPCSLEVQISDASRVLVGST